jgi:2-dehydropantoate 2-reductase
MTLAVSIIGNGAIGGLLKARCHSLGLNFNVLTRKEDHEQLTIELLNGHKERLTQDSKTISDGDINELVILPVKAYQVESVIDELRPRLQPNACLVMLHNGMGSQELIQDKLPNQPTILATTSHAAYKVSRSYIKQTGLGQSHYGWLNLSRLNVNRQTDIEQLLDKLLQPSILMGNMQIALWKKLAVNAVINPMTAVLKVKNGHLKSPSFQQAIETICQEVSSIAAQHGQKLSTAELVENTYQVIDDTAANYSSMYQDVVSKRKTEIESISGYIVNKAAQVGDTTPENKKWLDKVQALENTYS